MSWFDKLRQAFSGSQGRDKSHETAILSSTSKTDASNRVKPKQDVIPFETEKKLNILATTSKTGKSPTAIARANNPEMQARIDKRTRVIDQ